VDSNHQLLRGKRKIKEAQVKKGDIWAFSWFGIFVHLMGLLRIALFI